MTSALTLSSFFYFLLFCATMTFSPGPMTLLLLSLGLRDGLRSSIPAQIGASVSYLISILVFAVGFSELIKGNPSITQAIQVIGVAYILHLAYKQWTSNGVVIERIGHVEAARSLFRKGLLTGFSNPKTIIMFSAVFPQFAGTGEHRSTVDIAILGLTFLLLQFVSGCLYCYFGQRIKQVLQNPQRRVLLQRITAVMLLGVALMLARGFAH
ncbi:homoserine/homoserine lactone efflux protein [Pseudomonas lurida]|jgi:threonine/homoserine/homoserine lactone efflux protein|uniref:LysE family translocator n=1 Tax=Pseudomonas lurida TaxID=244566 RepID=UPI00083CAECF|nr:LysE family translocator [Pseudomonas lurida]AOE79904.1 amino acid transporter [Pseudomonas lurida]MBC3238511.1 LysE family translocator [Pseudomonas lurida]MBD8671674.1 LysE family translocator [Pseudomonas lurida]PFG24465.1 threonine/homoserine/homoserine lactone efflux protein [Pseudomonas lurida]UZQ74292.1 LysE family translocator [Pseudomonas lurida]